MNKNYKISTKYNQQELPNNNKMQWTITTKWKQQNHNNNNKTTKQQQQSDNYNQTAPKKQHLK